MASSFVYRAPLARDITVLPDRNQPVSLNSSKFWVGAQISYLGENPSVSALFEIPAMAA
jgi:hypothetical protein